MANITAQEQLMLELINRGRMDPAAEAKRLGISLNAGLKSGAISTAAKQVLAMNDDLAASSDAHSAWMIAKDVFSHTGVSGTNAGARMTSAGYDFSGRWSWGENIAWRGSTAAINLSTAIVQQHRDLFASAGHRVNLMKDSFKEAGIGQQSGGFKGYSTSMVTQNFAASGDKVFVTGVVYNDTKVNDNFYSIGEGLKGSTVSASGKSDISSSAGGYELALSSGSHTVTIGSATLAIKLGSTNVKLDLVNGKEIWTNASVTLLGGASEAHLLGKEAVSITGSSASEKLYGNAASNTLKGNSGNDKLYGDAGNDKLYGDAGNDQLSGSSGNDCLTGGMGRDILSGGSGSDIFDFNSAAEASLSADATNRDIISDFVRGADKIDLSGIDANGVFSGSAAFSFLSAKGAAFNETAGQLKWHQENLSGTANDKTIISGDIDGDGAADFQIELTGLVTLTAGDFIL